MPRARKSFHNEPPTGNDLEEMMADVPEAPISSDDAAHRRDRLRQVDDLLPVVYEDLHDLAQALLHRCQPVNATCTTSLIHDVYMRLAQRGTPFRDRSHFLCLAARAMRFVLIDRARRLGAAKRVANLARTLDDATIPAVDDVLLFDVDEALTKLAGFDERKSRIVELRFFGGLSVEEAAEALGLSPATVKREWTLARAWLYREIADGQQRDSK